MTDTVRTRGIDSSGRAILASDKLWAVWLAVVAELGFTPTITQGSWMSRVPGGGAAESEGFHDKGGPMDLRVWDRTPTQRLAMVKALRLHGCAAWRRYKSQGFSEDHLHFVLGTDDDLSPEAAGQWHDYINGGDGLSGDGRDYEWRPSPLVLTPPEADEMEYTDWSAESRKALAADVAAAILAATIDRDGDSVKKALRLASGLPGDEAK